jgi:orotate phosphoribosyltransferase
LTKPMTAQSTQRVLPDATTIREVAFQTILRRSFRRGSIKLSSGKVSEYYLDMKPSMMDPDGSIAVAMLLAEKLKEDRPDYIGGLAIGAVPLVSFMVLYAHIPGFFVRRQIKEHGTKRLIEGASDIARKKVVILDDVTTTGDSAMIAVRAAQDAGARVAKVLSVVDREEGAASLFAAESIAFDRIFTGSEFLNA